VLLLVGVILLAMACDMLVGSASAKWAILSPILVPMFMLLGIAPEATQAAYRVGDSTTNMITPFMSYFPLILVMARKYMPDYGIGSMVALMLPYTVAYFLAAGTFFIGWFLLDPALRPGGGECACAEGGWQLTFGHAPKRRRSAEPPLPFGERPQPQTGFAPADCRAGRTCAANFWAGCASLRQAFRSRQLR
jgi:hypothetical protein